MLYYLVRPITYLGFLAFCKKIYLSSSQPLPKHRPVILASNHPTAFLEPCIMASFTWRPLHYLVRGDFFRHPFYRKLMLNLHLIPIYRSTNASFSELKKNMKLMEIIGEKLNENVTLMILVEGSASVQKGLRPLQTGMAKMAFDYYEKYGRDDLLVVPVGANFDDPTQWRMTPMIHLDEGLPLANYIETYQKNRKQAIQQLMQDVQQGMRRNIIHVEHAADEELVEQQLRMHRAGLQIPTFPIVNRDRARLAKEIAVADYINQMDENSKAETKTKTNHYFEQLALHSLKDATLVNDTTWWRLPLLLIGFIPFLIGFLCNALLPIVGKQIAKRRITQKIQYLMPIAWGIANLGYVLYWIILMTIAILVGQWWLIVFVFCLPLLGYFSIIYLETFDRWRQQYRYRKLSIEQRNQLHEARTSCFLDVI
ncbi:MAG: 1-acyl-sn-glycerol-3-phosphate acyltransferase [Bacteroidota bacterium]